MRSLLLTSSALFILAGGVALAHTGDGPGPSDPGNTTNVSVPVVKNAGAALDSSAATTGGTAINDSPAIDKSSSASGGSTSASTGGAAASDSFDPSKNSLAADGSASATSGGTANNKSGNVKLDYDYKLNAAYAGAGTSAASANNGSEAFAVGDISLSLQRTNTHLDVTSYNEGNVNGAPTTVGYTTCGCQTDGKYHKSSGGSGGSLRTGDNNMSYSLSASNGVIAAQQNSGINALQQSSVSIGAQVGNGTISSH